MCLRFAPPEPVVVPAVAALRVDHISVMRALAQILTSCLNADPHEYTQVLKYDSPLLTIKLHSTNRHPQLVRENSNIYLVSVELSTHWSASTTRELLT